MAFQTDIVAVDLRRYPHSPALLADLAREGYELFNPEGMVFFRKHNRLASVPVAMPESEETAPAPEPDEAAS
jgi:hypothetical protein